MKTFVSEQARQLLTEGIPNLLWPVHSAIVECINFCYPVDMKKALQNIIDLQFIE